MRESTELKKTLPSQSPGKESGKKDAAKKPALPNSVFADLLSTGAAATPPDDGGRRGPSLESAVTSRLPHVAARPQPQIPSAEREASSLARGVQGFSPGSVKSSMGRKLGADFSGVSFHTDAHSAHRADAMGAKAFTAGSNVYFGSGGFSPETAAHELVHTVQQGAVSAGGGERQRAPGRDTDAAGRRRNRGQS